LAARLSKAKAGLWDAIAWRGEAFLPGGGAAKGGVHLIVLRDELQKDPGISARKRR